MFGLREVLTEDLRTTQLRFGSWNIERSKGFIFIVSDASRQDLEPTVCGGGGIKQLRSEADRTHFAIQQTVRNEPIYISVPQTPPSYT